MREIIFRGRMENGTWIEGDLRQYPSGKKAIRSDAIGHTMPVDPETVGQYTGLEDMNGRRIFEGDILMHKTCNGISIIDGVVVAERWNCSCCDGVYGFSMDGDDLRDHKRCIVIGNIHDNPELMDEGLVLL